MLKLDKNKKYLLACSFGTDSMVLFYLLLKEGYNFSVAHVNYNLRKESILEQESLSKITKEYNIELFVHEVKEPLGSSNLEAKCREIRYDFFKKIYKENSFDALLVAHQQDDLIETYLLQTKRKNIVSYYGLSPERYVFGMNVIRPILHLSKNDINAILKENNIPHSVDKTNLEDNYDRNKIRHSLVEKLSQKERVEIVQKINELNEKSSKTRTKLMELDLNSSKVLMSLDQNYFEIAIFLLLEKSNLYHPISKKCTQSIFKILLSEKPNVIFPISKNIIFKKEYDYVAFVSSEEIIEFSYILEKPGVLETPYFKLDFRGDTSNRNVTSKDYPLTIRTAKKEDRFTISNYEVSVRRAFIDWKMPLSLRKRWPLICNAKGEVIYVPRYSKKYVIKGDENFIVKI